MGGGEKNPQHTHFSNPPFNPPLPLCFHLFSAPSLSSPPFPPISPLFSPPLLLSSFRPLLSFPPLLFIPSRLEQDSFRTQSARDTNTEQSCITLPLPHPTNRYTHTRAHRKSCKNVSSTSESDDELAERERCTNTNPDVHKAHTRTHQSAHPQ